MKYLVCSRADDNIKEMTDLTFPFIKEYAHKCGADFQILDKPWKDSASHHGNGFYHYRIMWLGELLQEYDRILHLDADVLVRSNCPSLFDYVYENYIGSVNEVAGTRRYDRIGRLEKAWHKWPHITDQPVINYINTGVFIVSKRHADIFSDINGEYWAESGFDDLHLRITIKKGKHEIQWLSHRFNHMTMFSEPWNNNADRFGSDIIHYAGNGVFSPEKCKNKIEQIKHDIERFY